MDWHDHIDSDPAVIGGKPRIKGTRIGVQFLLERLASGWTIEEILLAYPHLKAEHIQAVFAFAADFAEDIWLTPQERKAA